MNVGRTRFALPLAIAFILSMLQGALALEHAPADFIIRNQAVASVSGERYFSNVVETKVLPLCRPSLLPNGSPADPAQKLVVGMAGEAVFPYTLSNAGNKDFTFDLSWVVSNQSDWNPDRAALYQDVNQNGVLDPGEPEVRTLRLQPEEMAYLLLQVRAPSGVTGSAFISPVATCPDGTQDADNYSEVLVRSGPALAVEKRFSVSQVKPGDTVAVTLYVRNLGDRPADDVVYLTDDLSGLPGFVYLPGSAQAPKGTIEYSDGSTWVTAEPSKVVGLRLRMPGLEVGEEAYLRFQLRALPDAQPGRLENAARAEGPGGPAEVRAPIEVLPVYDLYLGPKGAPRASGDQDRQQKPAFAGQEVCFEHTLLNASNVEDRFTVRTSGVPDGVSAILTTESGTPLDQPIALGPGESFDFKLCLSIPEQGANPFEVELVAQSLTSDQEDPTYDQVARVLPADGLKLEKRVEPAGTVSAGQTLKYTLTVENGYDVDLHNVVITDPLDEHLEYASSSPAGVYDQNNHAVTWQLPVLAVGETWQAELAVRVNRDAPDDTSIKNKFHLTSDELGRPRSSPEVENKVWSTTVQIKKSVAEKQVQVGDRVHYQIHLYNPGSVSVTLDLTDQPDPRLHYIPGSALPSEPELVDGTLLWRAVTLGPGEEKVFEYQMRVTAGALGELVNVASAHGQSANGSAVSTGEVRALVEIVDPLFANRRSTIVGRVFLDFDRDGQYDEGRDRPLPGARLVLSNGLQTTTDGEGRYAFRNVKAGVWLLKLDSASAPFDPLPHPKALEDGYVHRLDAFDLTTSDFPLAPPAGWIKGYRSTRLSMGPLVVEKELLPLGPNRYRVVLRLSTKEPLPEFELRDPLPGGGERVFTFNPLVGEKTITYDLDAPAWLTDPEVRWRYP